MSNEMICGGARGDKRGGRCGVRRLIGVVDILEFIAPENMKTDPAVLARALDRFPSHPFGHGIGKLPLREAGGPEARVQAVAEGHQFINFSDDAVLFL